jgi:hypothetical protein
MEISLWDIIFQPFFSFEKLISIFNPGKIQLCPCEGKNKE